LLSSKKELLALDAEQGGNTGLQLWGEQDSPLFRWSSFRLGFLYHNGKGVPQNYAEAAKWYRMAADEGDDSAQLNLGLLYYTGEGVPQDYGEAIKWYRKAAEQGDALALVKLVLAYAEGKGVPQDYVQAHMWANLAAASSMGEEQKKQAEIRDWIAAKMAPEQIAEAQRLAREWKPITAK